MLSDKRISVWWVFVVIALILLVACEEAPKESDLKASLGNLAEQYWNKRLMDKDYKATYGMEAIKDSLPFSEYQKRVANAGQIQYISIKAKDVKVEKDKGFVDLTVKCRIVQVPKDLNLGIIKDPWILKSGKWKHVLEKK
ncbi:MAG: hypothetical protein JRL30_13845 [Deltaproteobacteria bacterium]|nr:hypothetical protein [Deltaproteobacteria bacterium]